MEDENVELKNKIMKLQAMKAEFVAKLLEKTEECHDLTSKVKETDSKIEKLEETVKGFIKKIIPQNVGDDYVDKFGKIWKFQEEIGGKNFDDDKLKEMFAKYGLSRSKTFQYTVNLRCRMRCRKKSRKEGCKFVGIYVKENGCLYTRGEHEHE